MNLDFNFEKSLISLICFLPLLGASIILFINGKREKTIRGIALLFSLISLALSLYLLKIYTPILDGTYKGYDEKTFLELKWIEPFNIYYRVCVDKLSILLLCLTSLLSSLALIVSTSIKKNIKGFNVLFLFLLTGMNGVFVAGDLFLFYVFWELMQLPMYFLIGIWGGEKRIYAAIKFFLYTFLGSVLILLAILAYYYKMKALGFANDALNIQKIIEVRPFFQNGSITSIQYLLFFAFFIGFAIKLPVFPFHTWLPDAHVEAPTAISVILAGVLLKMGAYGLLRINFPFFPEIMALKNIQMLIAILGITNIIYGAFCALAQSDLKKLVAYSSISHMGYIVLGLACMNEIALNGAVFQVFAHAITSSMMFILVDVIYRRANHREIANFGGIAHVMPKYFAFAVIGFFASLGLPSLVGFIGEFLTLLGALEYNKIFAVLAGFGMLLTAGYILVAMQKIFLGEKKAEYSNFSDITSLESVPLTVLAMLSIIFGIFPSILINEYMPFIEVFKSIMNI
ncbi:MAG: complex I subunit 4 family protein [Bdellovibrionota bacterium]